MIHAILAMAYYQSQQSEEAQLELSKSHQIISDRFKRKFDLGDGKSGFWFDWIAARIFLREAQSLIEGQDAPLEASR